MMSVSISSVVSSSVLNASTSLVDAITLQAQGAVTQVDLVSWLCSTPFDLTQCGVLMGVLDAPTFAQVVNAQTGLIASKARAEAAAESGGKISCKISKKGAISVYGIQTMPTTWYANQWTRFLASQGVTDTEKSAILALIANESASEEYCFADYCLNKSNKGYTSPLKDDDLKWARSLATGFYAQSHSFKIDGKPANTSATASEMVDMLQSCNRDLEAAKALKDKSERDSIENEVERRLVTIRQKCAGIAVTVRLSRKAI